MNELLIFFVLVFVLVHENNTDGVTLYVCSLIFRSSQASSAFHVTAKEIDQRSASAVRAAAGAVDQAEQSAVSPVPAAWMLIIDTPGSNDFQLHAAAEM